MPEEQHTGATHRYPKSVMSGLKPHTVENYVSLHYNSRRGGSKTSASTIRVENVVEIRSGNTNHLTALARAEALDFQGVREMRYREESTSVYMYPKSSIQTSRMLYSRYCKSRVPTKVSTRPPGSVSKVPCRS